MNMQIPEWATPGIWGAVIGAAAISIIGLNGGWVVTSGTAKEMAERQTERAVIEALAPICVAQFKNQSQQEQTADLAALEEKERFARDEFVEEHGWATLPGSTEPNDEIASACASELMKLANK
jgi:hypothetical protein